MKKQILKLSILLAIIIGVHSCTPNTCANGVKDGTETGIDCGGVDCPACPCGGGGTLGNGVDLFKINLKTQYQVDSFGAFNYEVIHGTIALGSLNSDIVSLEPLCSIRNIFSLEIGENIQSINGLNNIDSIGVLWCYNSLISDFNDLPSINYISSLLLYNNTLLIDLSALSNVYNSDMHRLHIVGNPSLNNLNGIENLKIGSDIGIANNNLIQSLNGLNSNIDTLNEFEISGNPLLNDFCAINNQIFVSSNYLVGSNLYNPTLLDLQNGDCTP